MSCIFLLGLTLLDSLVKFSGERMGMLTVPFDSEAYSLYHCCYSVPDTIDIEGSENTLLVYVLK